jgi:hypothetical protein
VKRIPAGPGLCGLRSSYAGSEYGITTHPTVANAAATATALPSQARGEGRGEHTLAWCEVTDAADAQSRQGRETGSIEAPSGKIGLHVKRITVLRAGRAWVPRMRNLRNFIACAYL